jgi:hypothetical protein
MENTEQVAKKRPIPILARSFQELTDLLKRSHEEEMRERILRKLIPLSDTRGQGQEVLTYTRRGSPLQTLALKRLFHLSSGDYELGIAISFALKNANTDSEEVLLLALRSVRTRREARHTTR